MAGAPSNFLHAASRQVEPGEGSCPLCEQLIPHEARERVLAKDRQRSQDVTTRLHEQFALQKASDDARAKAEFEKLKRESEDRLAELLRQAASRESAARDQGKAAAEAAVADRLTALEAARLNAEQRAQALQAAHEAAMTERLHELREALESAHIRTINEEKSKAFDEKLKLEEKLADMQRQLQKKSTDELGESAEIDLFEQLRAEFPGDKITRFAKGEAGADTLQEVWHNGRLCGRIVYESKNSNGWRNDYVAKLRQDQLAAVADHAVLSTNKLPANARQVHVQDTVIVCHPARVVAIAQILRRQVVQMHGLRLTNEERSHKTAALYDFITSARCGQHLDDIDAHTGALEEIDAKEIKAHQFNWKKRGEVIRKTQRALGDLRSEIERITGTGAEGGDETQGGVAGDSAVAVTTHDQDRRTTG